MDFTPSLVQSSEGVILLLINCGGLVTSIIAFLSIAVHPSTYHSIRIILLSYNAANIITTSLLIQNINNTGFLIHNMVEIRSNSHSISMNSSLLFSPSIHYLNEQFIVTASSTLSVGHLMLLMLGEYIKLVSPSEQKSTNFIGLVAISWIVSVTFGCITLVNRQYKTRIIYTILMTMAIIFLVLFHRLNKDIDKTKKAIKLAYMKHFLRGGCKLAKASKKSIKPEHISMLVYSYACCTLPWIANEARNQMHDGKNCRLLYDVIMLMTYSCNFYFPSAVCIFNVCDGYMLRRCRKKRVWGLVSRFPFCKRNRELDLEEGQSFQKT